MAQNYTVAVVETRIANRLKQLGIVFPLQHVLLLQNVKTVASNKVLPWDTLPLRGSVAVAELTVPLRFISQTQIQAKRTGTRFLCQKETIK